MARVGKVPLAADVAAALIIYMQCEAARWRDVDRFERGKLDVYLRGFSPGQTDDYHTWRLRWMQACTASEYYGHVHDNPGLEWNF
jgi:hypothetical protein